MAGEPFDNKKEKEARLKAHDTSVLAHLRGAKHGAKGVKLGPPGVKAMAAAKAAEVAENATGKE